MVFIAFAFGLAGAIVGAVLMERLNDLESKVDHNHDDIHSLEAKAAITEGLVVTRSAVPPEGHVFGGSLHAGSGEWAPAVHLPEERSDLQAVACGGTIVVLGGINGTNVVQSTTWTFDPVAEVWATDLPPMPIGRFRFSATCLDGHVYVAGGYASFADGDTSDNAKCLANVSRYDVAGKTWDSVANLATARGDMALAASAGKLYAIGGFGRWRPSPRPRSSTRLRWWPRPSCPTPAKAIRGGDRWGDLRPGWNGKFKDELVAYDAAGNSWSTLAPMQAPRGDKAVAVLDGRLYVVGGETWSGKQEPCPWDTSIMCDINKVPIHGVEQFTPATGAWVPVSPLPR